ncbi:uracil-DNA glycosylase family protein [Gluconobacter oxydans]|uniref:Uncharacterized protein n=2 Tax=Gluconobacter oxydans TaxID=442 RepID=Q5FQ03_GLUOX|nr:hypothetical protein [Gluconobacter oxydans]AAW61543.1 Hypothetical protein GOX1804 [Gluconobacter oxydans 621H]TCW27750.1 hypothetical protein EDC20_10539 [Gluconobacter oxydans]GEC61258.1 hypothetical protein GOX01_15890 [Gluconobacter oxydans]
MTLRASTGPTASPPPPLPASEGGRSGIGPLSAEMLIVCLDPEDAVETLGSFLRANNIVFDAVPASPDAIVGRITTVMQLLSPQPLALPSELEECSAALCTELQNMHRLKLVLTLGISAHIAVLGACGIPLSRLDFRPGEITHLPDGLLLADGCHFPTRPIPADMLTQRRSALTELSPKIRAALRPVA